MLAGFIASRPSNVAVVALYCSGFHDRMHLSNKILNRIGSVAPCDDPTGCTQSFEFEFVTYRVRYVQASQ